MKNESRLPAGKAGVTSHGFTLIELMVVVAIIGVLAAVVTPQVSNSVYKAKVASTAMTLKNFKMALDMLINDIGVKPNVYGGVDPDNDQLALMIRGSCPGAYQSSWNGPYVDKYPTRMVSSLFYYPNTFWYLYSWPGEESSYWGTTWCRTGWGILLQTAFISSQAKRDVVNTLLGRVDQSGDNWLYYCGFYDNRQISTW